MSTGPTFATRKLTRAEAERLDAEALRERSSAERMGELWDLTIAWMDLHGIPAEERRIQRSLVRLQRRGGTTPVFVISREDLRDIAALEDES